MKKLIGFSTLKKNCIYNEGNCDSERNRAYKPPSRQSGKCSAENCPIWRHLKHAPKEGS